MSYLWSDVILEEIKNDDIDKLSRIINFARELGAKHYNDVCLSIARHFFECKSYKTAKFLYRHANKAEIGGGKYIEEKLKYIPGWIRGFESDQKERFFTAVAAYHSTAPDFYFIKLFTAQYQGNTFCSLLDLVGPVIIKSASRSKNYVVKILHAIRMNNDRDVIFSRLNGLLKGKLCNLNNQHCILPLFASSVKKLHPDHAYGRMGILSSDIPKHESGKIINSAIYPYLIKKGLVNLPLRICVDDPYAKEIISKSSGYIIKANEKELLHNIRECRDNDFFVSQRKDCIEAHALLDTAALTGLHVPGDNAENFAIVFISPSRLKRLGIEVLEDLNTPRHIIKKLRNFWVDRHACYIEHDGIRFSILENLNHQLNQFLISREKYLQYLVSNNFPANDHLTALIETSMITSTNTCAKVLDKYSLMPSIGHLKLDKELIDAIHVANNKGIKKPNELKIYTNYPEGIEVQRDMNAAITFGVKFPERYYPSSPKMAWIKALQSPTVINIGMLRKYPFEHFLNYVRTAMGYDILVDAFPEEKSALIYGTSRQKRGRCLSEELDL